MNNFLVPGAFPQYTHDTNESTHQNSSPRWDEAQRTQWTDYMGLDGTNTGYSTTGLPLTDAPRPPQYETGRFITQNYELASFNPPLGQDPVSFLGPVDPLSSQSIQPTVDSEPGLTCLWPVKALTTYSIDHNDERDADPEDDHDYVMEDDEGNGPSPGPLIDNPRMGGGIKNPKFIPYLFSLAQDPNIDCIGWTDDGRHLVFSDEQEFMRLMKHAGFKAKQFSSFVRQLNGYGFAKTERSGNSSKDTTYHHKEFKFLRDQPKLIHQIRRSPQKPPTSANCNIKAPSTPPSDSQTPRAGSQTPTPTSSQRRPEDVMGGMQYRIHELQIQVQGFQQKCRMLEEKAETQEGRIARLEDHLSVLLRNAGGQLGFKTEHHPASATRVAGYPQGQVPHVVAREPMNTMAANFAANAVAHPFFQVGSPMGNGQTTPIAKRPRAETALQAAYQPHNQVHNPAIPSHLSPNPIPYPTTTMSYQTGACAISTTQCAPAAAVAATESPTAKRRRVDSSPNGSFALSPNSISTPNFQPNTSEFQIHSPVTSRVGNLQSWSMAPVPMPQQQGTYMSHSGGSGSRHS
ncbi:hypothetical protein FRB93_000066 [Tulasnella sp. JGI-2019a]|nr:hypothetical protein FRB93_000066 [Tulasnella sp. JGI-2019a]